LSTQFAYQSLEIIKLDKGYKSDKGEFSHRTAYPMRNTFKEFLNKSENFTHNGRYMYYIHNEPISTKSLMDDLVKPTFIAKALRMRLVGLTIWESFIRKA
jgi:hypothetical protein